MLGRAWLVAEIVGNPKNEGSKNTGVLLGFYAPCLGAYCDTRKIKLFNLRAPERSGDLRESWRGRAEGSASERDVDILKKLPLGTASRN